MLEDLTHTIRILQILNNRRVTKVVFDRVAGLSVECRFNSLSEVYGHFQQLDVKGKVVTFAPIATASYVNTIALPIYHFKNSGEEYVFSCYSIS